MFRATDAHARAYGPSWLCNDGTRPFWPILMGLTGDTAGAERELSMIADRKGLLPQKKIVLRPADVADGDRPQSDYSAVGRAYLLLIDRENPLSSLRRRR